MCSNIHGLDDAHQETTGNEADAETSFLGTEEFPRTETPAGVAEQLKEFKTHIMMLLEGN